MKCKQQIIVVLAWLMAWILNQKMTDTFHISRLMNEFIIQHRLEGLLLLSGSLAKQEETNTRWIQNANIFISPTALVSLPCLSTFGFRKFGLPRHFTHAKTHRAGGFLPKRQALCALEHKVGPRLFTLAFHTQISLLSPCQVDSLMRGWSARDFCRCSPHGLLSTHGE